MRTSILHTSITRFLERKLHVDILQYIVQDFLLPTLNLEYTIDFPFELVFYRYEWQRNPSRYADRLIYGAVKANRLDCVQFLAPFIVDIGYAQMGLMAAINDNRIPIRDYLLSLHVQVNDIELVDELLWAIEDDDLPRLVRFVDAGCDIRPVVENLINEACLKGHLPTLRYLHATHGADLTQCDVYGSTPFETAASQPDNMGVLQWLVQQGAHMVALQKEIDTRDVDTMCYLVKLGATNVHLVGKGWYRAD